MSWIPVNVQGRTQRVAVVRSGNGVLVSWGGMVRKILPETTSSGVVSVVEREVRAPMTGRVVKVIAAAGAQVRARDPLIVLEAMKMEYRLTAPRDGVIETVTCAEGERVDLGRVLVTLAP
jgi:3-methylcrotonyl-CoA carboxylase alpha subunit